MDDKALERFKHPGQSEGWVALLSALHHLGDRYQIKSLRRYKARDSTSWPGIRIRYRSWDSMPADINRPVATTTLGEIAVIARRMGMSWKTFNPDKANLAAQGCGHSLTSVEIRALGLALRYLRGHRQSPMINLSGETSPRKASGIESQKHIWSREADMLMFGVIPGDKALGLKNFNVNTIVDIRKLMNDILALKDHRPDAPNWDQWFPKKAWRLRYEINELRGIVCPILRQAGSTANFLRFQQYGVSIWLCKPARTGFESFVSKHPGSKSSHHLKDLLTMLPAERGKLTELEWLELHHKGHDFTTKYFKELNNKQDTFFWDLVRAHFSRSPLCSWNARQKAREKKHALRNKSLAEGRDQRPWRNEQITMLWDCLPHFVSFMQGANSEYKKEQIEEAWITLWFRAVCWETCHQQEEIDTSEDFLAAQWYGSQLPVYLL